MARQKNEVSPLNALISLTFLGSGKFFTVMVSANPGLMP